jgi:uncharacterized glyoxalase superfamily protein PhnB
MKAFFVLYVSDQEKSAEFYQSVLGQKPELNVPGMTEFKLSESSSLGLMPSKSIKKLLGDKLPDPSKAKGIPRAELYLTVDNPNEYHQRALKAGATELSELKPRTWGDKTAYSMDPDGHIIAFACPC